MKRLITDDRLRELIVRAEARETSYYTRVASFLGDLIGEPELTRKEHNWLSQIRAELKESWE